MADDSKYDSEVAPIGGTRVGQRNSLRAVDVDASHRLMVNIGGLGSPAQSGEAAAAADQILTALDLVVALSIRIPITASTATIAAILTALSTALPAGTRRVVIAREDSYSASSLRYHIGGAASATTEEAPGGVLDVGTTKTVADTIQLYSASSIYATLVAYVART